MGSILGPPIVGNSHMDYIRNPELGLTLGSNSESLESKSFKAAGDLLGRCRDSTRSQYLAGASGWLIYGCFNKDWGSSKGMAGLP